MVTATPTFNKAAAIRSAAECVLQAMRDEARVRGDHLRLRHVAQANGDPIPGSSTSHLRHDMSLVALHWGGDMWAYALRKGEGQTPVDEEEAVLLIAAAFSSEAEAEQL